MPTVRFSAAGQKDYAEGAGFISATIELSEASSQVVTVKVAAGGSSVYYSIYDLDTAEQLVTFQPGETSKIFKAAIYDDIYKEFTENYSFDLYSPTNATLDRSSQSNVRFSGTIIDNDPDGPKGNVFSISPPQPSKMESAGPFTFTVTRTGDPGTIAAVDYFITGSGASPTSAADFGNASVGSVYFGVGDLSKTFTIEIENDQIGEPDEEFTVSLRGQGPDDKVGPAAKATILNDDGLTLPLLTLSGVLGAFEGNSGPTTIHYSVVRAGNLNIASTVNYVIDAAGLTAQAEDFLGGKYPSGQLSFAAGESTRTFDVSFAFDKIPEPDETYSVVLENPVGARIDAGRVTGTIYNDDRPDLISSIASGLDQTEGGSFIFTIGRNDASQAYTFTYSVQGYSIAGVQGSGTAPADGADFAGGVLPSGTISLNVGEFTKSVTIGTNPDSTPEPNESFLITFKNSYAPNSLYGSGVYLANGTILDDDSGPVAGGLLGAAFNNILSAAPGSADASFLTALASQVAARTLTQAQALDQIITRADATTSVATMAYEFFTGKIPSSAGMTYLVSPTGPNPNNLNSAYYQSFSVENRYINFAVNLGKVGEGAAKFAADYGALDLSAATTKAYKTIFGTAPTADKVHALLDPTFVLGGVTMTRAQYFAYYGQDGPNGIGTKAAMVGWLLAEAEKADIGMYAKANHAFLMDLADGATFGVDLVGAYGKPEFAL